MLLITHDLGIVAETCDSVAIMYGGHLVEYSGIKELYTNPRHPYTQGLFNAVPTLESPLGSRLAVIPGLPPDPTNLPKGCSFRRAAPTPRMSAMSAPAACARRSRDTLWTVTSR